MDIQWSIIWAHSHEAAARPKKRDAFADPLDRPEWESLGWTVPLVSRLVAGSRRRPEKMQTVERFTTGAAAKPVCVS